MGTMGCSQSTPIPVQEPEMLTRHSTKVLTRCHSDLTRCHSEETEISLVQCKWSRLATPIRSPTRSPNDSPSQSNWDIFNEFGLPTPDLERDSSSELLTRQRSSLVAQCTMTSQKLCESIEFDDFKSKMLRAKSPPLEVVEEQDNSNHDESDSEL